MLRRAFGVDWRARRHRRPKHSAARRGGGKRRSAQHNAAQRSAKRAWAGKGRTPHGVELPRRREAFGEGEQRPCEQRDRERLRRGVLFYTSFVFLSCSVFVWR